MKPQRMVYVVIGIAVAVVLASIFWVAINAPAGTNPANGSGLPGDPGIIYVDDDHDSHHVFKPRATKTVYTSPPRRTYTYKARKP